MLHNAELKCIEMIKLADNDSCIGDESDQTAEQNVREASKKEGKQTISSNKLGLDTIGDEAILMSPTRFVKGPSSSKESNSLDRILIEKEGEAEKVKIDIEGFTSPASQEGTEMESKQQAFSSSNGSITYEQHLDDLSWEKSEDFSQHDFVASDLENDINDEQDTNFTKHKSASLSLIGDAGCANLALARESTCSSIKLDGFSIALSQALTSFNSDMLTEGTEGIQFDDSDSDDDYVVTKRCKTGFMGTSNKMPTSKAIGKRLAFKKTSSTKIAKEKDPLVTQTETHLFF